MMCIHALASATHAAQVHPWAVQTILLTLAAWAALFVVAWLSRPFYRQRPPASAVQPGTPGEMDLTEFVSDAPAFDSPYAVSPAAAAGDEQ